ncbi:MAG: cation:proton antiporter [Myxococcales bacterium]|nr:cation:proton antiporter [Myxococcales bacterium]
MEQLVRLAIVLAVGFLTHAVRSFDPAAAGRSQPAGVVLGAGFVLVAAFFVGRIFAGFGLPRLTGYLAAGILAGPGALGLVNEAMLADLKLVNGVAVALIALGAGAEIDLRSLRPMARLLSAITLIAIVGTSVLLVGVLLLIRPLLPFMEGLGMAGALGAALVTAVAVSAQSPAVVVAVKNETGASGLVATSALATVVIADLVVIMLFAVASTVARMLLGGQGDVALAMKNLAWELGGSILAGLLLGGALALYLRKVQAGRMLFVLALAVVAAEIGQRLHLDPLIVALCTGLVVQNVGRCGHALLEIVGTASIPVAVLFFAVAGAALHLDVLAHLALPVAILVVARAVGFLGGTRLAARLAGAPDVVGRWTGFGLLPQAGLAIALGLLLGRTFPEIRSASELVLGVVAINELIAPVFFRWALVRAGEARAEAAVRAEH